METNLKLTPPQKITVVESIIEQIVSKIRDGELIEGAKLPSERQLIDMLGVSRSSVREALQGLAAMGLVETRSGEGTFIKQKRASFDLYASNLEQLNEALQKEMRHSLREARTILERGIVTFAAENITAESSQIICSAWETLKEFERRAMQDPTHMNWQVHDRFHISLAEASGNPFLVHLLKTLLDSVPLSLRDRNLIFGSAEVTRRVFIANQHIHEKLCKAVTQGDAHSARKWVQYHSDYEKINIDYSYDDQPASEQRKQFEDYLQKLQEDVD